jgi:uncharacterized protein YbbC (DUF1343 family)
VKLKIFVLLFTIFQQNCSSTPETHTSPPVVSEEKPIVTAAERVGDYLPLLKGKSAAFVVNQTSILGNKHLVDSLISLGVNIKQVFAPEHGFRGKADAGEKLTDGVDQKTGIPITSLYGKKRKPGKEDLKGIEIVVFDIQDVGARFYTYISTMTLVMEACAENSIPFVVLDRPNPNGHYVDGPVLQEKWKSFVGMHPIPVVHGMTVGELALMINKEGWLENGVQCDLTVIACQNYDHNSFYDLPVKPSPNLPNIRSIYLYPSLCLFEGTVISAGRGTEKQFQLYGHPDLPTEGDAFTPISREGAKYPKHQDKNCFGVDLTKVALDSLREDRKFNLKYILKAYEDFSDKENFFIKNNFFEKLAGGEELRRQIKDGLTEEQIKATWKAELDIFKANRKQYLLYKDFE